MRVLLLNQTFFPDQAATSQQLMDLALHLKKEGCQVTVMAARRAYGNPKQIHSAQEDVQGIHVVRVGSTGFGRRSFFHRFIDGVTFELLLLGKLLFFPRQDLVIAFTSPPLIGFVGLLFTALRGGKCVQWMMDLNPDIAFAVGYLKPRSWRGRLLTAVLRLTARASDFVVVLDRWMRQRMLAHGVHPERIIVAPPWPVSEPTPIDSDYGRRFRERHNITQKFVVLYSGNHSVAHPLDTILQTAWHLRDDKDLLFLFIGGGLRQADVTRFRETHGLSNIRQLPHQPRELLHESLSAGDLHVVTMGQEMSGLVHTSKIYGVLATGRPYVFIGPRASHVGDLIHECPYGFLVEHGDIRGLQEVIERARALTDAQRAEISQKNRAHVEQHCSAAHSLTTFLSCAIAPLQSGLPLPGRGVADQLPSRA